MNHRIITFIIVCASIFSFTGCELTTDVPKAKQTPSANHIVINEVFTLPINHPAQYSWVELYNPSTTPIQLFTILQDTIYVDTTTIDTTTHTADTVRVLTLKAFYLKMKAEVYFENPFSQFNPPAYGGNRLIYIPLSSVVNSILLSSQPGFSLGDTMFHANGFAVYVNNPNRLLEHTSLAGPGALEKPFCYGLNDPLVRLDSVLHIPTTARSVPEFTLFQLGKSSEISIVERTETYHLRKTFISIQFFSFPFVSIDSMYNKTEQVIDLVRYGNYSLAGDTTQMQNKSIGFIPDYYSLSRYSGAFVSSPPSTKSDFYMESQPIPMWQSSHRHP